MSDTNTVAQTLTFRTPGKEWIFPIADLPEKVQVAFMQTTLNHKMGNEVESKLVVWKAKETKEVVSEDGTKTQVPPDDATVAAKLLELREGMAKAIREGTYAMRAGGVRGPRDPVADKAFQLAMDVIVGQNVALKLGLAKKDLVSFAEEFLEMHEEELMEKAKRALKQAQSTKSDFLLAAIAKRKNGAAAPTPAEG